MEGRFKTDMGWVTVNEDVLLSVAGTATLECYGIVGMASKRTKDGFVQLLGRENLSRGVKIRSVGEKLDIDLFIIVEYGISIRAVAETVIETVRYKVENFAGVEVNRVNIFVEDIRV